MCRGLLVTVEALQLDIKNNDSITACFKPIKKQVAQLDVFINNNAGIATPAYGSGPTLRMKLAKFFDTNVYGATSFAEA